MTEIFRGWRRKAGSTSPVTVLALLTICLVVLLLVVGAVYRTWRSNAFAHRHNVMREVCHWLTRGEGAIEFPHGCYFDNQGTPLVGWRVQVVADCLPTHEHFAADARWSSFNEIAVRGRGWVTRDNTSSPMIMALVGTGTAFENAARVTINDIPSDTILFVEVVRPDLDWREPVDIDIDTLQAVKDDKIFEWMRSDLGNGFHVAFADCQVWFLSRDVPAKLLAKFAKISNESRSRDAELLRYRKDEI